MSLNTYTIETPQKRQFTISSHADDKSVQPMLATGVYEAHVQLMLEAHCVRRNHILDIGCNYGQHTMLMSFLNPGARITAIEASPENIEVFKHNLEANGIGNVDVINAFLGARDDEEVDYFYETSNSGCAFGCETSYGDDKHSNIKRRVKTVTLDSLIDEPVDFIKMDIEGSELAAIDGGERVFRQCNNLLVELNKFTTEEFRNQPIDMLIDRIESLGFRHGILYGSNQFHTFSIPQIAQVMADNVMCEVLFVK